MGVWLPQLGLGRKMVLLLGQCLEISSAPILRDPVPEMPWTVTYLASVMTLLLSPNASLAASLQKSPSPPMGAYSLLRLLDTTFCSA